MVISWKEEGFRVLLLNCCIQSYLQTKSAPDFTSQFINVRLVHYYKSKKNEGKKVVSVK